VLGGGLNFEWLSPEDYNFVERATTARQAAIREHLEASAPTESTTTPSSVSTLVPTSSLSTRTQPPSAFPTASTDDPDVLSPLIDRLSMAAPSYKVSARLPTTATATAVPAITMSARLPTTATARTPSIPVTVSQPSIASPVNVLWRSSRATKGTFSKPRYIDEVFLSSVGLMSSKDGHEAILAYVAELQTCSDTGTMDVVDP
jgi:hypothetical protein